jgi:hypothetical protein
MSDSPQKIQWMKDKKESDANKVNLASQLKGVLKKHAAEIKRHALILKASAEALQDLDKKIHEECLETAGCDDYNVIYNCGILAGHGEGTGFADVVTLSHILQEEAEKMA